MNMKKIYLIGLLLAFAVGAFAQSKGKNTMMLRLVDIKVTDGTLLNTAREQEAKGNLKPKELIEVYESNVRSKLNEVVRACGRFEISDQKVIDVLDGDAVDIVFLKNLSKEERIEYVSSLQNDYALSCDINSCQFTRKAGGAGYSCVIRLKVNIYDARDSVAAALVSREFLSDIKKTLIRPNRDAACQEALSTLTEPLSDFFMNNIPVYGLLNYEGDNYVVTCGENLRIKKGDQFQVSLVTYSDGERKSEVVGVVKVKDVLATTSVVSFSEGKDRILELIPTLDINSFLQCRLLLLKSH